MIVSGYASIFNTIDMQNDVILPSAIDIFTKNIRLLWQNNQLKEIGVIRSFKSDEIGFFITAEVFDTTSHGRFFTEKIKLGFSSLSIGYSVIKSYTDSDSGVRYIEKLKLIEVSVVSFGANPAAKISSIRQF